MAYETLDPDPAEWTMQLTAQLLTLMANVYRDTTAHPRPYQVAEFLPREQLTATQLELEQESQQRWWKALAEMRARYAARRAN